MSQPVIDQRSDGQKRTEKILAAFHDEDRFTKSYDGRLAKQIWRFLSPHRGMIAVSVIVLLITSPTKMLSRNSSGQSSSA